MGALVRVVRLKQLTRSSLVTWARQVVSTFRMAFLVRQAVKRSPSMVASVRAESLMRFSPMARSVRAFVVAPVLLRERPNLQIPFRLTTNRLPTVMAVSRLRAGMGPVKVVVLVTYRNRLTTGTVCRWCIRPRLVRTRRCRVLVRCRAAVVTRAGVGARTVCVMVRLKLVMTGVALLSDLTMALLVRRWCIPAGWGVVVASMMGMVMGRAVVRPRSRVRTARRLVRMQRLVPPNISIVFRLVTMLLPR